MNETDFHRLADATIDTICDALEEADASDMLDLESQNGIVTITAHSGKQWVVNKHAPTLQLWLSSPMSGGLHFHYVPLPLREGLGEGLREGLGEGRLLQNSEPEFPPTLTLPLKGGGDKWQLTDGRILGSVLAQELQQLAGVKVQF